MKEGVLEQRGCSFQVDKFQQLSTNQGLICVRWWASVPKIQCPHSGTRTICQHCFGNNKGCQSREHNLVIMGCGITVLKSDSGSLS